MLPLLVLVVSQSTLSSGDIYYDDFTTYNSTLWSYADKSMGTTDGCKVWYLKNHSNVNANLSSGEGRGLRMVMSSQPCKSAPQSCKGVQMAADHVESKKAFLYGDYELRMRAPYTISGPGSNVSIGIYAYFTAGYASKNGKWNEMNFGFHPGLSSFVSKTRECLLMLCISLRPR